MGMQKLTGNEPAMPKIITTKQDGCLNGKDWFIGNTHSIGGLTIRQYYAGLAMQGVLSCSHQHSSASYESVAKEAIMYADALIKELNKNEES